MPTTSENQAACKEGRILLAINAYENSQFSSIQAAAHAYNISLSYSFILF